MSWDVLFQNLPDKISHIDDIPENFKPNSLCSREYYEKMVFSLFPNIDENNDRSWMILNGNDFSIEFNSGDDDPMDSLMLHVRGNTNALQAIKKICDYSGWKAIDTSLGDFIDFNDNPDKGFSQWRDFRNKVTGETENTEKRKWWQFWK